MQTHIDDIETGEINQKIIDASPEMAARDAVKSTKSYSFFKSE